MFKVKSSKFCDRGITLIEIVVVIFIIVLFSMIIISDFPKIQRQLALSRVTYKLAQDLRKTEDLGMSGVQVNDVSVSPIKVKGYGIYLDLSTSPAEQYLIYADVNGDQKYDSGSYNCTSSQYAQTNENTDCIIETIDISRENPSLFIKNIVNLNNNYTSINFNPPGPTVKIDNLDSGDSEIGIVLGLNTDSSSTRTVWVNTSGLINVK